MPSNDEFSFKILVGGTAITEYEKDGEYFVECCLSAEVSYKQKVTEKINGEDETQEWPVTPYEIQITADPESETTYYYRVFVDGVKIKGISLEPGDFRVVNGFRDGAVIRELLFSMPRFAQDETDRITEGRVIRVGQIEVECWEAELIRSEWKMRQKDLDFTQANKKDSYKVTQGQFTMATSKAGKVVNPRRLYRCVDNWKRKSLKSRLVVNYRMGHVLQELGFKLRPFRMKKPAPKPEELDQLWEGLDTPNTSTAANRKTNGTVPSTSTAGSASTASFGTAKKHALENVDTEIPAAVGKAPETAVDGNDPILETDASSAVDTVTSVPIDVDVTDSTSRTDGLAPTEAAKGSPDTEVKVEADGDIEISGERRTSVDFSAVIDLTENTDDEIMS